MYNSIVWLYFKNFKTNVHWAYWVIYVFRIQTQIQLALKVYFSVTHITFLVFYAVIYKELDEIQVYLVTPSGGFSYQKALFSH